MPARAAGAVLGCSGCRGGGTKERALGMWLPLCMFVTPQTPLPTGGQGSRLAGTPPEAGVWAGLARVGCSDSVQTVPWLWSRGAGVPALSAGRPQVPPVKVRSHSPVSFGAGGTPPTLLGVPPPWLWWVLRTSPFSKRLPGGLRGCPSPPGDSGTSSSQCRVSSPWGSWPQPCTFWGVHTP